MCIAKCLQQCSKTWDEVKKNAEIEKQKEMERNRQRINEINRNINNLDNEHNKMDRRIFHGNPLNDSGYQTRMIEFQDRKYLEQRQSLEKERNYLYNKY